jgi:NAD(P)H-hydrate epimerase
MRSIEQAADAAGLSYARMMENAGAAVANAILDRMGDIAGKRVVLLVGSGNNGGDALVAGHYLAEAGAQVAGYLVKALPAADPNLARLAARGLLLAVAGQDQRYRVLDNMLESADIVIDGVLGTGFRLPLKGSAKDVLARAKKKLEQAERMPFLAAVDCPSGVDCDSGEAALETLAADLTVTLAAAKPGLLRFPGANYVGDILVADIGIPRTQKELNAVAREMVDKDMVRAWLPPRPKDAHKGTFGRAVVVAGSVNYPGAAALAGMGAYRVGAGLVTMAVPGNIQTLIAVLLPEATWIVLPHEIGVIAESAADVLYEELESTTALLVGPGFGLDPSTERFMGRLLGEARASGKSKIGFAGGRETADGEAIPMPPSVFDADGLKLLARIEDWPKRIPAGSILTPHPGEMAVLTGETREDIQANREKAAVNWAKEWGHVVVLKGAHTVVAAPDGRMGVLPFATPALARAGTGDVLAGAIVGFRAQGVEAYEAAVLGAYVHGRAGELAAEMVGSEASVLAGDVAAALPKALAELTA